MSIRGLKTGVATAAIMTCSCVMVVTSAQAGGFALREQSSVGQGASFAGVAAGTSLSSVYWNPSTLTGVSGVNTESVFTGVIPHTDVKDIQTTPAAYSGLGNPGDVGLDAFIPSSYSGMQLTEDLFVGLSVNAPFGMATKAENPSATSFHAATAEIFTTDVKANVAYRINKVFSVGFGVGATYGKVRMTSAPGGNGLELKGDAWAPTFSAGVTITPFEGTIIGIGYRSETQLDLDGTEYYSPLGRTPITADLDLPQSVTIGLRQTVTDRLTFLAGFEWAGWSSVKDPIIIQGSALNNQLHLGYEDSWFASVGGEYQFNDNLTVRSGLGFEKSPIPTEHRNLRLPDADRVWASFGASYNVNDRFGIDVGYSHLFIKDDVSVSGSNAAGAYTAVADSSADIVSASLRYQWQPEPLFENDEPFDRQY
ncbi:OmpP1/FadL family transporter [Cohaesibacter sp. ES.047]|uniref:OmpP1/FadL family transporter n=1 Tax=Cohaesibacter sp. ES.047 TaxID=1798205 RepID=UPI0012FE5615|nr:outer membrane protein transport protein [Cohaesibacter sp. ES.047]